MAQNEIVDMLKDLGNASEKRADEIRAEIKEIKTDVDNIKKQNGAIRIPGGGTKTFGNAFAEGMQEAFESKRSDFERMQKDRDAKVSFQIKAVGDMTLGVNLTGDAQASYNNRQGLVPNQRINFRDLIPVTQSPTGLYVSYRETGTEGAIAVQTEGAAKSQIDYDFTEVKVVSDYIAGFARFSKQMLFNLPWLQSTLSRMLLRDFYKKENSTFYSAVASGATGNTTVVSTVDAEELIELIANQRTADFDASFIIVSHAEWARLLKTKPNDYSIPGGVQFDPVGNIRIAGVPVIPASFATDDKAMIIDSSFIERVETEGLRVELSFDDADNFTKNLVTARVECFEDINLLRTDAHIYADLGNVV